MRITSLLVLQSSNRLNTFWTCFRHISCQSYNEHGRMCSKRCFVIFCWGSEPYFMVNKAFQRPTIYSYIGKGECGERWMGSRELFIEGKLSAESVFCGRFPRQISAPPTHHQHPAHLRAGWVLRVTSYFGQNWRDFCRDKRK